MKFVSDEEFNQIRDDLYYKITQTRQPFQVLVNTIDAGKYNSKHDKVLNNIFDTFYSDLNLMRQTNNFSKKQLAILAQFENEMDKYKDAINQAKSRRYAREAKINSSDDYDSIVRDIMSNSTSLFSENYVTSNYQYDGLLRRIDTINDFQNSDNWNYLSDAYKQHIQSIKDRLLNKKTEVEKNSVDVSKNVRYAFTIIAIVLTYLSFEAGWAWLFLTIPLTYYYILNILSRWTMKKVQIVVFAIYTAIMLSIILPIKWSWVALIPLAILGNWYINKNHGCIGNKTK